MGRITIRSTKSGTRMTTRSKCGNVTITRTTGGGKKPRTTITTRGRNITTSRTY